MPSVRPNFETAPERYRHWQLAFDGPVATLSMDVVEGAGLSTDYRLKLNSYDLAVDIELADAIQRIRFEHPETRAVVITSLKDRIFCAGANIFMLAAATHAAKVNFCKFTNETRLAIEDASRLSGIKFLAALNGICAGGGYELALACDEILLIDDSQSAVSLPEAPLLGVLPGTGGLTRLVDKRCVRRDIADYFCTLVEGVKGKRAVAWGLVDAIAPKSQFAEAVEQHARQLVTASPRRAAGAGIALTPLGPSVDDSSILYSSVSVTINRTARVADLTIEGPSGPQPSTPAEMIQAGDHFWPLRTFRELDDAILRLRMHEPEIGTMVVRTRGGLAGILALDRTLMAHRDHWLVAEIIQMMMRTLKRLDLSAKSVFAVIEPDSAFGGSLFELALAADRSYMLHDDGETNVIALSAMNGGPLRMGNGLTRLETRFLADRRCVANALEHAAPFNAAEADRAGLVTFAPDEIDWDDEVRLAVEARAAFSPDAMTGLEANLRFAGPETMETKIFARLSAWQNWIFQRPNAIGEQGALKAYGRQGRPHFEWGRT